MTFLLAAYLAKLAASDFVELISLLRPLTHVQKVSVVAFVHNTDKRVRCFQKLGAYDSRVRARGAFERTNLCSRRGAAHFSAASATPTTTMNTMKFYRKCTIKELRAFIKAKSGEDPPKGPNGGFVRKAVYIEKLRQIDENAVFDFMNLPPEMRNLIYEHLLIHDKATNRKASTAIIRTNQQVYREAQSFLLAESTLSLHASFLTGDVGDGVVTGDIGTLNYKFGSPGKAQMKSFIQPMQNAQNLAMKLTVVSHERPGRTAIREMLVDFLEAVRDTCPNAKKVRVEFECFPQAARLEIPGLLWPLMFFTERCTLKLRGLTSEEWTEFWGIARQV